MSKQDRNDLIDSLLTLAAQVENGEISECSAAYVQADGKTGHVYLLPRDGKKLLVAIDRSKHTFIRMLEEEGTRP